MNKKYFLPISLLLLSLSSWVEVNNPEIVEIECEIKPIDRSKIHRNASTTKASQSLSSDWSGYVASTDLTGQTANHTVNYVAGCWVIPTLTPIIENNSCAIWAGMDGWLNNTIEHIGTAHYVDNGIQQNFAWFEMYPEGASDSIS